MIGSNKASGSASVAPTTLRIKLVDPKPHTSTTPPTVGRGAGSKNLSRMNRPQESTETAKAKAISQIPINVFWNQVESFFKPIDDADMKFLCDPSRIIDPTPFVIPPLGRPYQEQWREQYGYVKNSNDASQAYLTAAAQYKPTLKERLLSLLIFSNIESNEQIDVEMLEPDDEPIVPQQSVQIPKFDYVHIDERLRKELAASGLEEFANSALDYQEDDSICTELRSLQRQLQEQVVVNYYRKRKLSELTKSKLPAQEFYSLLFDLDKQLEQMYLRRTKFGKKKSKKGPTSSASSAGNDTPVSASVAPSDGVRLLENRAKLLHSFQPYIPKLSDYLKSDKISLINADDETSVLKMAQETGSWLPLPNSITTIHTEFTKPLPSAHPIFPADAQ